MKTIHQWTAKLNIVCVRTVGVGPFQDQFED